MDALTLSLPQSLDISVVTENQQMILNQIHSDIPFEHIYIDAEKLTHIDTAGLQLLTAVVIQFNTKNIDFSWKNISTELSVNATRLGLYDVLKLN